MSVPEFIRRNIQQHTLQKVRKRERVRASKLVECLKISEEYEPEKKHDPVEPLLRFLKSSQHRRAERMAVGRRFALSMVWSATINGVNFKA
jgi:hypothetical protein